MGEEEVGVSVNALLAQNNIMNWTKDKTKVFFSINLINSPR